MKLILAKFVGGWAFLSDASFKKGKFCQITPKMLIFRVKNSISNSKKLEKLQNLHCQLLQCNFKEKKAENNQRMNKRKKNYPVDV